jgi:hypothetical protein
MARGNQVHTTCGRIERAANQEEREMKTNNTWKKFYNLLNIPEGKSGTHEVIHEHYAAGASFDLTTPRGSTFGAPRGKAVRFPKAGHWHKLIYEHGTLMSDLPIEQFQMEQAVRGFRGNILIGGLGLGVVYDILCNNPDVKQITVVEKSQDVINLVAPHLPLPVSVVHADLFDFIQHSVRKGEFDHAFYDIWQSDGENTYFNTVLPLRYITRGLIPNHRVVCWNDSVMLGQLFMGIQGRTMMREQWKKLADAQSDDLWLGWTAEFFQRLLSSEKSAVKNPPEYANILIQAYLHHMNDLSCLPKAVEVNIKKVLSEKEREN